MRIPQYLSPTSLALWARDPADFYIKYMSDTPTPKEKQTFPMAVGGGFDALVKSVLHANLFGKGADPRFEFTAIFENQVEPQHRTQALEASNHLFECYRNLGALDGLMLQLGRSVGPPRFEMDVRGTVSGRSGTLRGVPFNGKPDLFFTSEHGAHVILDWKVNGWSSKSGHSPMKGYVKLREDGKLYASHPEARLVDFKGLKLNAAADLPSLNEDWARQLSIYSWLCGEEVGAEFVACVHQLVCRPGTRLPRIRVAEHACRIPAEYQESTFAAAARTWEIINSGWVFRDMTPEDSARRCADLDARAATLSDDDFSRMFRG